MARVDLFEEMKETAPALLAELVEDNAKLELLRKTVVAAEKAATELEVGRVDAAETMKTAKAQKKATKKRNEHKRAMGRK